MRHFILTRDKSYMCTSNRKTIEKRLKSTETRDELSTTCNPKVMSSCLSTPDATSLHHCLQNHWETGFIRYMPSPYYPTSVVLFQLHGGIVSHMQVLATPSSTVHNTKYLDPYH